MHLQFLSTETQECLLKSNSSAYNLAVAIAVAYACPRPVSLVENIEQSLDAAKPAMKQVVGWFNEARPVNLTDCLDMAGQIWKALYEVAHGIYLEKVNCASSPLDMFGIGYHLSPDRCKELCENFEEVGKVLGACVKAARHMQQSIVSEQTNG